MLASWRYAAKSIMNLNTLFIVLQALPIRLWLKQLVYLTKPRAKKAVLRMCADSQIAVHGQRAVLRMPSKHWVKLR